jgi:hypothetical protein
MSHTNSCFADFHGFQMLSTLPDCAHPWPLIVAVGADLYEFVHAVADKSMLASARISCIQTEFAQENPALLSYSKITLRYQHYCGRLDRLHHQARPCKAPSPELCAGRLQSHTQTHHNPIAVFTLNDHLPSQYASYRLPAGTRLTQQQTTQPLNEQYCATLQRALAGENKQPFVPPLAVSCRLLRTST